MIKLSHLVSSTDPVVIASAFQDTTILRNSMIGMTTFMPIFLILIVAYRSSNGSEDACWYSVVEKHSFLMTNVTFSLTLRTVSRLYNPVVSAFFCMSIDNSCHLLNLGPLNWSTPFTISPTVVSSIYTP